MFKKKKKIDLPCCMHTDFPDHLYSPPCHYFFSKNIKFGAESLNQILKNSLAGLSPSKRIIICFIENPLKMIQNAFYFIFKALFVLRIFKFLSWLFGQVEKRLD